MKTLHKEEIFRKKLIEVTHDYIENNLDKNNRDDERFLKEFSQLKNNTELTYNQVLVHKDFPIQYINDLLDTDFNFNEDLLNAQICYKRDTSYKNENNTSLKTVKAHKIKINICIEINSKNLTLDQQLNRAMNYNLEFRIDKEEDFLKACLPSKVEKTIDLTQLKEEIEEIISFSEDILKIPENQASGDYLSFEDLTDLYLKTGNDSSKLKKELLSKNIFVNKKYSLTIKGLDIFGKITDTIDQKNHLLIHKILVGKDQDKEKIYNPSEQINTSIKTYFK